SPQHCGWRWDLRARRWVSTSSWRSPSRGFYPSRWCSWHSSPECSSKASRFVWPHLVRSHLVWSHLVRLELGIVKDQRYVFGVAGGIEDFQDSEGVVAGGNFLDQAGGKGGGGAIEKHCGVIA